MQQNNVFTIAKRNVEGQDMLYQSLKLTNGIWVLNELKIQPGNPNITVRNIAPKYSKTTYFILLLHHLNQMLLLLQLSLKSRALDVAGGVFQAYDQIIHS